MSKLTVIHGDCLTELAKLPSESVQMCVTSPPYWGLRDYGHPGQIGMEKTYPEYVAKMVAVFAEVRRVLKNDGTLWLNLGDSYATGAGAVGECPGGGEQGEKWKGYKGARGGHEGKHGYLGGANGVGPMTQPNRLPQPGLKPKDLVGIPWRVAFGLQADGWYLRSDIIWHKPNPMPESVTDRPTKAHEYIFLLTKSERYSYDASAIAEPLTSTSVARLSQDVDAQEGSDRVPGKTNGKMKAVAKQDGTGNRRYTGFNARYFGSDKPYAGKATKDYAAGGAQDASATKARIVDRILAGEIVTRNKRTVWTVTTKPFKGAHFATFPPELITPCILAGSRIGDMVLDPFGGSGTSAEVALGLSRDCTLIELNGDYLPLIAERTGTSAGHLALHV